ncbi:MAG: hypothetical protein NC433_08325 [Clostridiales bacterium]|nr:hypothetical protein [Clostridiales bacterium]
MKSREKYIAVIFMIFILFVPAATLVKGFLPEQENDSSPERDVLENNGALRDDGETDNDDGDSAEADAEANAESEPAKQEDTAAHNENFFAAARNNLNGFIERLFLRDGMIKLNEEFTMFMTGGRYIGSTQLLLGKNNWLFYKREDDGQPIWDYMGINKYSDNDLIAIVLNLTETRNYFRELGIDFYVITVPNKEIVYAEYMPDTIIRVDEVSRGEQVANYIKEKTDLVYLYPKQAFQDVKDRHQVYYTTDTHWNQKGAFVGLQEIFKEAYGTYADLDSVEFKIHTDEYAGDLAMIGNVTDKYDIDTVYVFDSKTANPSQYRDEVAIIVGDSFSGFLSIVAEGYYKEVHWIDISQFTMDMVAKYDADVIIWETGERRMDVLRDTNLLAK